MLHSQVEEFHGTENNEEKFGKIILRSSSSSKKSRIVESSSDSDISEDSDHIDPEDYQKLKRIRK